MQPRLALVSVLVGLVPVACGGVPEQAPSETIGRTVSAFTCSPAGTYTVSASGTWRGVTEPDYKCTGVLPTTATFRVTVAPDTAPGKWSIMVGSRKVTAPETDGVIETTITGLDAQILCGSANSGRVTVRIDDTSVFVRRYCQWMSASAACVQYSDVKGTVTKGCDPADGGVADAAAEAGGDGGALADAAWLLDAADVSELEPVAPPPSFPTPPNGGSNAGDGTPEETKARTDPTPNAVAPTSHACAMTTGRADFSRVSAFGAVALSLLFALRAGRRTSCARTPRANGDPGRPRRPLRGSVLRRLRADPTLSF